MLSCGALKIGGCVGLNYSKVKVDSATWNDYSKVKVDSATWNDQVGHSRRWKRKIFSHLKRDTPPEG
jgi:hypothetical protein